MRTLRRKSQTPHADAVRDGTADAHLSCRFLPAADALRQPWRNGGGITHQIAIWPPTAQGDDLIWRISAADVAQPGNFSNWDGFERQLWITHGVGMRLTDPVSHTVTLLRQGMCLDFPGERCYACDLLEGPVRDLNVMLRRGHGTIRSVRLCGHHAVAFDLGHHLIYCVHGRARVRITGHAPSTLAAGDALLLHATAADRQQKVVIDGAVPAAECIAVHLGCGMPLPSAPIPHGK